MKQETKDKIDMFLGNSFGSEKIDKKYGVSGQENYGYSNYGVHTDQARRIMKFCDDCLLDFSISGNGDKVNIYFSEKQY